MSIHCKKKSIEELLSSKVPKCPYRETSGLKIQAQYEAKNVKKLIQF